MIVSDPKNQLGVVIALLAEELDVPESVDRELRSAYDELAYFLSKVLPLVELEIYPQGSRRIGTMVRPVNEEDDYDIDLVLCRSLLRGSTSQAQLKDWVGERLREFVRAKVATGSGDVPTLSESCRCWTLTYPTGFHLDVLPAIPNDGPSQPDGILITDRDLRFWQVSNPRGYAEWFLRKSERSFLLERERLAKSRGVEVEAIPEQEVKTPLHRAVQLLKRHRDVRFEGPHDDRPASILITTLAGLAYADGDSFYDAIRNVFSCLLDGVEERNGVFWVANPVDPAENFADRWRSHPERARAFFEWAGTAAEDFERLGTAHGLDELTKSLGSAFGKPAAGRTAVRLGEAARAQRERGELFVASTGRLGGEGARRVKDHTFFGS